MSDDFSRAFSSGVTDLGSIDFDQQMQRFAAVQEKAEQAKRDLAEASATASSKDQAVTVTVGAGGVMQSLRFGPRAERMPMTALASSIMTTYTTACRDVAERAASIVESITGEGSDTSAMLRAAIPEDPEDEGTGRYR
jgi:DNA-binding protein YbaB